MKLLKQYQLGPWCGFCPPKTSKAIWKSSGMTNQQFACNAHQSELKAHEIKHADNGHMSEGDYQSWGRL